MKNQILGVFVCILLLATIIPLSVSSYETKNRTIYVDDDNTQGPWDGSQEYPYQFIQDGIRAAVDGDTVYVYSGFYKELLWVDTSIILQGEERDTTVIHGDWIHDVIRVFVDLVWIHGFTIQEGYNGIKLHSSYSNITGNTITNASANGIYLGGSSDNTISGNIFIDNGDGIEIVKSSNNTISGNTMKKNKVGIRLTGSLSNNNIITGNNIIDNIVLESSFGNTIIDNSFYSNGIIITGWKLKYWNNHTIVNNRLNGGFIRYYKNTRDVVVPGDTTQVILANCTDFIIQNLDLSNGDIGVQVGFSSDIIVRNNTILDNNLYGIYLEHSSDNTISGSIINDTGCGIDLSSSDGNNIIGNTVTNSGHGVSIFGSFNNIVRGNIIMNSLYDGIDVFWSNWNTISRNNIYSNNRGVYLDAPVYNSITENNFKNNICHASFCDNYGPDLFRTIWSKNYWDDWPGIIPRPIIGKFSPTGWPWLHFDWRPARVPYDIP